MFNPQAMEKTLRGDQWVNMPGHLIVSAWDLKAVTREAQNVEGRGAMQGARLSSYSIQMYFLQDQQWFIKLYNKLQCFCHQP